MGKMAHPSLVVIFVRVVVTCHASYRGCHHTVGLWTWLSVVVVTHSQWWAMVVVVVWEDNGA